jgi:hypothetical protein
MPESPYRNCPSCPTAFSATTGLVRHLTDDHWWAKDIADLYGEHPTAWRADGGSLVSPRPVARLAEVDNLVYTDK